MLRGDLIASRHSSSDGGLTDVDDCPVCAKKGFSVPVGCHIRNEDVLKDLEKSKCLLLSTHFPNHHDFQ